MGASSWLPSMLVFALPKPDLDPRTYPPLVEPQPQFATAVAPQFALTNHDVCSSAASQTAATRPRIFDLVLCHHEYDLMSLRVAEIASCVDFIVFVQMSARLSDGAPVDLNFPEHLSRHPKVRRFILDGNRTNEMCRTKHYPNWCRRSIGGNALGHAFNLLGGDEGDWAIVSDGDEISGASGLAWLRSTSPVTHNRTIYQLLPHHRFKCAA